MHYDIIHKKYWLGMGLYFQLVFGHEVHPSGWISLSNIPTMNYKKLENDNQEDAVLEVMAIVASDLELEYTEETVKNSLPKHYPKVEFNDGSPQWTEETKAAYNRQKPTP